MNGLETKELRRLKRIVKRVTAVYTRMNERNGNSRGNVEVKCMPDTAEFTDIMTGAG